MKQLWAIVILLLTMLLVISCTKSPTTGSTVSEEPQTGSEVTGATTTKVDTGEKTTEKITTSYSGTIEILGKQGFDPEETTVKEGAEVVFVNHDPAERNVVLNFQNMNTRQVSVSPLLKAGEEYSHRFTKTGTYSYWTTGYGVKGKIVVE